MIENFNGLAAFSIVAKEKSFTKAAAKLAVSSSALSQTIRNLEERLGVRLLARTTRSVATTDAGERLLNIIAPRFEDINNELSALSALRDRPAGTIRLNTGEHPAIAVLQPALKGFLHEYPDIKIEIIVDYGLTDIVKEGYDAGIRLGEQVAKDMVAVKISGKMRMAVVASPEYFAKYSIPKTPYDLKNHNCINMRLPTYGGIFPWNFEKNGREINVKAEGQLVFNNLKLRVDSALDSLGLAYVPEDAVLDYINQGQLIRVLEDWCESFAGFHLYYPSRRQQSPVFALLVKYLRYHGCD